MERLTNFKIGDRVTSKNSKFLKITKISKFNVFLLPTNYPTHTTFKVSISEFLREYNLK